jgi:hypothetical protein
VATSDAEVAWLAGLLEGEGSFYMLTSRTGELRKAYRYPKIQVSMTDRDIIDRVSVLFGTKTYAKPPARKYPDRRPQWQAQISGVGAAEWMVRLRPWLGERRRAKIDEVLIEYGTVEPTEVRRRRACSEAAARRPRVNGRFVARSA